METKPKILAVDDNLTNLEIFTEILEDDYNIMVAESGERALEILQDFQPEIILLDIMMPGIDGYQSCMEIRKNPLLKNTTIIMVSAKGMASDRYKGHEAGADDYITKPFNSEELIESIEFFLEQNISSEST